MSNLKLSIIISILFLFVVGSVFYTNNLARQLAEEEQQRLQLWAQATQRLIQADENEDIDFYTTIIERNTTVPVYMLDSAGNIYDESTLLTQLRYVPYAQFGFMAVFVLLAVLSVIISLRNEQNQVWVGLSKETAHQLGTPISSLNAWQELLESKYPNDELIPSLRTDIARLKTIADRFSKVGSEPNLTPTPLIPVIKESVAYMRTRISNKVNINFSCGQLNHFPARTIDEQSIIVQLNKPLFEWVIENLIKNAVDAMEGRGEIHFVLYEREDSIILDVTDNGKGIDRRTQHRIFQPGFTTKQRGWGLGLSLAKRIVEEYHRGKLFLKSSQVGKGSTFRIILKKSKDS